MGRKEIFVVFKSLSIALLVNLLLSSMGFAAPQILNYQGNLSQDGLLFTGTSIMVFRIYAEPDDPIEDALWNSGDVPVAVTNGVFSVTLGDTDEGQPAFPADLFDNDSRFLGITVDGAEMTERKRLASVPYALNSAIPKGGIIMWSGSVAEIPAGWAICDGQNDTPDLRDRFIVGAGSGYAVDDTGGESSHTLSVSEIPSHSHTVDPPDTGTSNNTHSHGVNDPGHSHTASVRENEGDGPRFEQSGGGGSDVAYTNASTTGISIQNNSHGHTVNIGQFNSGSSGGGGAHENRPPYYALCFIMKL